MALEGCYGPCDGLDTSLILSAWVGICGIVSISSGAVASHAFGEIESLPYLSKIHIKGRKKYFSSVRFYPYRCNGALGGT